MRHAIAKLLILFILFANIAWATDIDEVRAATESDKVFSADDQPKEHGSGHKAQKVTPCDHCCHGSAHYTGLLPGSPSLLPKIDCAIEPLWLTVLQSHDQDPPLRPPRI